MYSIAFALSENAGLSSKVFILLVNQCLQLPEAFTLYALRLIKVLAVF